MEPVHLPRLFPDPLLDRLARSLRVAREAAPHPVATGGVPPEDAEVLVTGWGCTPLTEEVLAGLPRLRAVLHAAGSVKGHVTAACWDRGLLVSSAAGANAVPVAEFTLGAILLCGKDALRMRARYAASHRLPDPAETGRLGNLGRRVGIVGASRIGRRVIELLRPFDVEVAVYDPYLPRPEARALGVRPLPLDELVATSEVLSLHAPLLPGTRHLLDARRLALLPDGAALVNTARGALVDTAALTRELVSGRISAVLDVTDPEPLPAGSPLHHLPNVLLTPHIAGALGNELPRLGLAVTEEAERLAAGMPLRHQVLPGDLDRIA
ncbi:hydroxyacid dehydrogenase [Streptomyces pactum]|uniref:Hydroxyacid dehydrogenase n=1 Tax=Streptomyces pactum TaxID=68249 RepID=A0ABS0NED9_9ACTN|nr:hydroxyacid dehydrogenase [Streptomyces pactum]MBH5333513.1 hydroxyacid dehydrogenase [Streptomyces pactum]MBH5338857.1 hydroxyacid dehydrogenase [Streptomyces pactum]